jgi:L-threonylcarbamoyladenylate synthase
VTLIIKVDPLEPEEEKVEQAAEIIVHGGLVAFPTETVYGLGADAFNIDAVFRLFKVKKRPPDNPLIVHISGLSDVENIAYIDRKAERLAEKFWPGPLTLVLRNKKIPDVVSGGMPTVAVRAPSHPVAQMLIKKSGRPIAAPSANIAGRPSPTRAEHVLEDLGGSIDALLDSGEVLFGLESTVVSMVSEKPTLLRPGIVTPEQIKEVVGELVIPDSVRGLSEYAGKAEAPGMKYRHYAPKAKMFVVEGSIPNVVEYINKAIKKDSAMKIKVGVLTTEENKNKYPSSSIVVVCGSRNNPYSVAIRLFDSLREMDRAGVDVIYSEGFPDKGVYLAISNRLRKASGYNIIHV